jgi:hypothetical protein
MYYCIFSLYLLAFLEFSFSSKIYPIIKISHGRSYPISNSSVIAITAASASTPLGIQQLTYMQTLFAGAISRTMAQTLMHPANTYKTILQLRGNKKIISKLSIRRLFRGAGITYINKYFYIYV